MILEDLLEVWEPWRGSGSIAVLGFFNGLRFRV
jgi:hypothetical protein